MTTAATSYRPPKGAAHPCATYTEAQIARAKAMMRDAPRVTRFAPGTFERISGETGVSLRTLQHLRDGTRWSHLAPAN